MPPTSPKPQTPWKGKGKADPISLSDPEFFDLEPVITYRHVLSNNFGAKDPLRVVALCDSDAFYATCEMVRLGVDREIPLVVLQWDALIAVNYPAREFGITRMIRLKEALKLCPHLKVVHVATYKEGDAQPAYWDTVDTNTHKVSLDYYRRESVKIAARFKASLPTSVEIERASIDEAFFDYTKTVKGILLQRYPYLAHVPKDAEHGIDTPLPPPPQLKWAELGTGHVVPLHRPPSEEENEAESKTISDSGISNGDETENSGETSDTAAKGTEFDEKEQFTTTWHDVALSIAAELMGEARAQVREMGYTTSAGIARNKFLAKLTASYKKPNSQSILRNGAIPSYLRPLPFRKIRFLGGKLGEALAKEYDVSTVGDLLTISLEEMQNKFGENAIWVYEVLRGIDRNEVKEKGKVNKSMLASKNLPKPIKNTSEGHHWIRVLAAELALRLNDAREENPNLWPKTLVLHARRAYDDGRSKQAPFPFVRKATVDVIAHAGNKLWNETVGTNKTVVVNYLSLAFTGIDIAEQGQKSIEGFLKSSSISTPKKRPRVEGEIFSADPDAATAVDNDGEDALPDVQPRGSKSNLSWSCPRCGEEFKLPDHMSHADDDTQRMALSITRSEHEDFHFAEDLSKAPDDRGIYE
ncbi:hypothetical protein Agabi119p4_5578 [Agaricus bisporus var. burnettii]|uniref:DNA polymerase eta n=1 Tax=Agaricus bisporus var. burnettii TaxID=192524 RepID=A0A8H7KGM7_AGABI|nr:hypothetical protein Agabi119p4_5578 [Agaricus bisporus var. burnettii]